MDPRATLIELLECIAARDIEGAHEVLDTLGEWLGPRGGFVPPSIHAALDALRFSDEEG